MKTPAASPSGVSLEQLARLVGEEVRGVCENLVVGKVASGISTMPHQTFLRTRFLIQRLPKMTK